MTTKIAIANELIKNTKLFDNEVIFLEIFDKLTNNGETANYSHNSNGIFFDLTKFPIKTLKNINSMLLKYKKTNNLVVEAMVSLDKQKDTMKKEIATLSMRDPGDADSDAESEIDIIPNSRDNGGDDDDYELFGSCSESD